MKLKTITSPSGARFTVAEDYAEKFGGLLADLEQAGYGINPKTSGGYNLRNIRGTNRPSNHAFGRAIDINWDRNALGTKGEIKPELARALAAKHGMTWGGDWSRPDPMHFEVAGVPNVPVSQRAVTRVAGVSQTQPPTTGAPMPTYKTVGGQSPVTSPQEVERQQALARALMTGGMDVGTPRHWTEALGSVLMSGVGMYKGKQAADAAAKGQQAGNQALAQLLMGGDPSAAMANPYSQSQAIDFQSQQKMLADRTAAAERLKRMELEARNADPMRQLQMEKLRKEISTPAGVGSVPAGYRMTKEGSMEPVPGGPADTKQINARAADDQALSYSESAMNQLAQSANELLQNKSGLDAITGLSSYLPSVSDASRNADAQLATLKSKVAFSALQAMRDASKTGGALGQVTERELAMLQNSLVPLEQAQTKQQFEKALADLIKFTEESKARIRSGYNQKYGGGLMAPAPSGAPDLKSKYGLE